MKQGVFLFSEKYVFSYFFVPRNFHQERVVLIEILIYLNYHFFRLFLCIKQCLFKRKKRDIGIFKKPKQTSNNLKCSEILNKNKSIFCQIFQSRCLRFDPAINSLQLFFFKV